METFNFWQNIKNILWKDYFNFSGLASRKEYWSYILFVIIVQLLLAIILILFNVQTQNEIIILIFIFSCAFYVYNIIPYISLTVRRLHDAGYSGFWSFLILLPSIGLIILIIWHTFPSKYENNPYRKLIKPPYFQ